MEREPIKPFNKEEFLDYCVKRVVRKAQLDVLRFLLKEKRSEVWLAKELGVSLPLVSYYVNGNNNTLGLKELGMVFKSNGFLKITDLGVFVFNSVSGVKKSGK